MPLRSWSKWSKHQVLAKHGDIASVLPDTRYMSESSLKSLLDRYGKVVLKPTQKWGGQGLMLVSRRRDGRYRVRAERSSKLFADMRSAWRHIERHKASRRYIAQQYVPLARVGDRPFDIRVMVQRRKGGAWAVTGKLAKVAGAGHFITNMMRSRGKIMEVEEALARSDLAVTGAGPILERLDRVSLAIARHLGWAYKRLTVIGLDMAVDTSGNVWFIEANFTPMIAFFRQLKDKSMYRRILRYRREA